MDYGKINPDVDFSELTIEQQGMSFLNFESKTQRQSEVLDWILDNFDKWMFFLGATGTGKTHLATSIYKEQKVKGKECGYTTNFEMLRRCTANFIDDGLISGFKGYDLLVIDEMEKFWRTQKGNEINIFFEIINARYANDKQTILISNLGWSELMEVIGKQNEKPLSRRFAAKGKILNCDWEIYQGRDKE